MSVQQYVGLTVESNRTNRFSGRNRIEIIFGTNIWGLTENAGRENDGPSK